MTTFFKKIQRKRNPPARPSRAAASRFYRLGNRLSVDFANTVRSPETGGDALASWKMLVRFLEACSAIGRVEAARLRTFERKQPNQCARIMRFALGLRSALRKIFEAAAAGARIREEWIAPINAILAVRTGHERLVRRGQGWRREFVSKPERPEGILQSIASDAAAIIEKDAAVRVRKCASRDCVLFFYDTSRTGRRRWCSMALCGNRAKVAAYYRRAKN